MEVEKILPHIITPEMKKIKENFTSPKIKIYNWKYINNIAIISMGYGSENIKQIYHIIFFDMNNMNLITYKNLKHNKISCGIMDKNIQYFLLWSKEEDIFYIVNIDGDFIYWGNRGIFDELSTYNDSDNLSSFPMIRGRKDGSSEWGYIALHPISM